MNKINPNDVLFAELYKQEPIKLFISHDNKKCWLKYVHLKGDRRGSIGGMNENMMSGILNGNNVDITTDENIINNAIKELKGHE